MPRARSGPYGACVMMVVLEGRCSARDTPRARRIYKSGNWTTDDADCDYDLVPGTTLETRLVFGVHVLDLIVAGTHFIVTYAQWTCRSLGLGVASDPLAPAFSADADGWTVPVVVFGGFYLF
ncbi:hypothetical protein BDN72DRAFT_903854 [Pluteus cervinus]|uniref:Uncharacterized protein n=1 Tax=Pluteus cervinus TaxID=181527 RepID=A0ACD3A7U8_9AGAR|nr:hypothetical protein BDN72DRAFT_903854 [Pluteus cervinus]